MNNYFEINDLRDIYLEDSFVLSIQEIGDEIRYEIEFVVTENHPLYLPPLKNERYCYKKGFLTFHKITSLIWKCKTMSTFYDVDNEIDYGHIDNFNVIGKKYTLSGDWGEVIFFSSSISLTFSS